MYPMTYDLIWELVDSARIYYLLEPSDVDMGRDVCMPPVASPSPQLRPDEGRC